MSDRLEGLDEELAQEELGKESKTVSFEEVKKKRSQFHFWEIGEESHKMKLTTGMIGKLENKYKCNLMDLVGNGIPPLTVMLTVAQAAITPWEHGTKYEKVESYYDSYLENGGNQMEFYTKVIMPTMAVSGFFTEAMADGLMKNMESLDDMI